MTIKTNNFEAVKLAMKQDKNGYVLTLLIHPDDIPEDVLRDFVGARYQIVAVRLNDDEIPMVERPKKAERREDPENIIQIAGMLCRKPRFWDWLVACNEATERNEETAVEALHRLVGVKSRRELVDEPYLTEFKKLRRQFFEWDNQQEVPF